MTNIELLSEFISNTPVVTVICLCFNHSKYVVESLDSVLNQTYKNIQLIIADDCSDDNSKTVIENWLKDKPEIVFIANETNLGNTKTFNNASKKAIGEYIIDLAADDILMPDCVSKQLKRFENSSFKNVALVYGNASLIAEDGTYLTDYFKTDSNKKRIIPQPIGDIYMGLLNGQNNVCSISSLIKKEVFDQLNGYNETLAYEDYDFWIRASRIYNFDYIDEILIKKRVLENSLGSQLLKKRNDKARKFNHSTYLIMKTAFSLNKSKAEFIAILKRIHYEMTVAFRTRNFPLLLKYIVLEIKVRFKIFSF